MNSNYKVVKFRSNNSKEVNDQVSIEEPLEIILKYKYIYIYLFTSGFF